VKRPALRAPFPWFGGKSRVAHVVWDFFGDVPNFVEPFAGSLAVLLSRPTEARIETVNDLDCFLSNFWRAVKEDPGAVADFADWPVNEADLHARHKWLVKQDEFRKQMRDDPHFYDAKIAGWWVWGVSQWIGSGWCSAPNWEGRANASRAPRGINQSGVHEKLPILSSGKGKGIGVHKRHRRIEKGHEWEKRPAMGRGGRGVQSSGWQQKPDHQRFPRRRRQRHPRERARRAASGRRHLRMDVRAGRAPAAGAGLLRRLDARARSKRD
jgi:hypothetical protein